MNSPRPAAALFDMDGTLVDSTASVAHCWNEVALHYGLDPVEIVRVSHGVRAVDTVRKYLPESEVLVAVGLLEEWELGFLDGIVPMPGAVEYLSRLEDLAVPVAVVTSASEALAHARFAAAGIRLPEVLVAAHHVSRGKPAPDGYLLAAEQLGVRAADSVVFEDAEAGLQAGTAAGARVVVVGSWISPTTDRLERIHDYRELLADPARDPFA